MKKGRKTTIVGVVLAIFIVAAIILKYMGKLGENLSEYFMGITGLITAVGLYLSKDSTASHTHDRVDNPNPNHEEK